MNLWNFYNLNWLPKFFQRRVHHPNQDAYYAVYFHQYLVLKLHLNSRPHLKHQDYPPRDVSLVSVLQGFNYRQFSRIKILEFITIIEPKNWKNPKKLKKLKKIEKIPKNWKKLKKTQKKLYYMDINYLFWNVWKVNLIFCNW